MKEFGDLHFTIESGFAQRSGVYELTAASDPEESKVIPRNLEQNGQPSGRVFQFAAGEETEAKPEVLGEQNARQRPAAQNPLAAQPTRMSPYERSQIGGKFTESVLSRKVLDALSEEIDPAKSLADIRRVLVGPTRRLHEARMEEVISILEDSDRAAQQALNSLEKRYNDLARTNEKLMAASDDTRRKIHDQSEHLNSELQKNLTTQQQMLSEMFLVFDAQLEKLTAELNQKVDTLAAKTGEDHHMLAADLTRRIQELAETTRADNDKVAEVMEARLARSEAHAEKENRRHIEVFADGFSDIADRLLALRGVQSS
jgi:predicted transcriptional regulator